MSSNDEIDYYDPEFVRREYEAGERLRQCFDDYAAALGRCMLAYNQLDYRLEQLIGTILRRLGAPKLPSRINFKVRVDYLCHLEGIPGIQKCELKKAHSERNTLAHAHFEMSPVPGDDSYRLVSRAGNELEFYDHGRIDSLTRRIDGLGQQLLSAEYGVIFGPLALTA